MICLCLAGCALEEVNSVSIIDYSRADNGGTILLKTFGNLVLTAAYAPIAVGGAFLAAVAESRTVISGGVSRSGIKINP